MKGDKSYVLDEASVEEGFLIGIDLGNTNSRVGVCQEGEFRMVRNRYDNEFTPSLVGFDGDDRLVGEEALEQLGYKSENTLSNLIKFFETSVACSRVKEEIEEVPFKVVEVERKVWFRVRIWDKEARYSSVQVMAILLSRLVEDAEIFLEGKVRGAVIGIPAYFDPKQREAMKEAGKLAGINVLKVLNEPTLVSIAYSIHRNVTGPEKHLVIDLGGSGLKMGLVSQEEGMYTTGTVSFDPRFKVDEFAEYAKDHLVQLLLAEKGISISKDQKAKDKLGRCCRNSIINSRDSIALDSFLPNEKLPFQLTQERWISIAKPLWELLDSNVKQVLVYSKINEAQINHVFLSGSFIRRIPIMEVIQKILHKRPSCLPNPESAVTRGAAIVAAQTVLSKDHPTAGFMGGLLPVSLGTDSFGDAMVPILPKNSILPTHRAATFTNCKKNQTQMEFKIYGGDHQRARKNQLLGTLTLNNITPKPKGKSIIKLFLNLDHSLILNAMALDQSGKAKGELSIDIKGFLGKLGVKE